jgi:hypothetical protein
VLWTQKHTVAVIKLTLHSVINIRAHSCSNTAYSAHCYEHSNTDEGINVIQHIFMNTTAHSWSNKAYSAQFYEQSSANLQELSLDCTALWTKQHTFAIIKFTVPSVMNTTAHSSSNEA